jgi:2-keto-4-pentenoate hydratase
MDLQKIAKSLRDAQEKNTPISPIREIIGEDNVQDAYEIQNINISHRVSQGARIVGKKIGLTSQVVQSQFGIDAPDYGILFNDMEVLNGQSISMSNLLQPKVEAEIAFILGEDLDVKEMTIIDIMDAIDYCLPAIEIVGSRIKDWNIRIADTIADNASSSHYVIGHRPRTLDEFDIVRCKMRMSANGKVISQGHGGACLGSPLNAVLWLANKMIDLGQPLEAGEVILSGALGPMAPVNSEDLIHVEIEGMGVVTAFFEK